MFFFVLIVFEVIHQVRQRRKKPMHIPSASGIKKISRVEFD